MDSLRVEDLMVPLAEYATVSEDADLFEAVKALRDAHRRFHPDKDPHRAILVLDKEGHVVGKLSQWDVIKGLEPNYDKLGDFRGTSRFGFSADFIRSLMKNYGLWDHSFDHLCQKAARIKIKDIMYTPDQGEFVKKDASLAQAVHQLIVGHHQSLLITGESEIVGILRLSDVFRAVCDKILECEV